MLIITACKPAVKTLNILYDRLSMITYRFIGLFKFYQKRAFFQHFFAEWQFSGMGISD
jgi:hypothetical protein